MSKIEQLVVLRPLHWSAMITRCRAGPTTARARPYCSIMTLPTTVC
jgi:hypothetical protein